MPETFWSMLGSCFASSFVFVFWATVGDTATIKNNEPKIRARFMNFPP
jgi:hypothetical protein